jgi:hypothetical protein
MSDINLKRKVTLKRKGDAPDHVPEGKKPNKFIWPGVIALMIIVGVLGIKHFNRKSPVDGGADEVVVLEATNINAGSVENESGTSNTEETNSTGENTVSDQPDLSNTATETNPSTPVESAVASKPSLTGENSVVQEGTYNNVPSNTGSQSSAGTVQGSVEDKVKQVIRGTFGNGSDRKQALGAEYDAIQAKVNEMYRNGLNN